MYKYCLESNTIGRISSDSSGIYLFHSIIKNDSLSNVFDRVFRYYNRTVAKGNDYLDYNSSFYLLVNGSNELPIECAVFGSYNEKYQQLKNLKMKPSRFLAKNFNGFVALMHWFQFRTIQLKMQNIVQK